MSRNIMQFQGGMQKDTHELNSKGKIVITTYKEREIALLLKENRLLSLYTIENNSKIGNIYIGKVKNVVKNLDACFVEIADKEIAYLPFSEAKAPILLNRKFDGRILQEDEILVQIQKDAIKTKQAYLTTKVSEGSEYFVFSYEKPSIGVSTKLSKELREQIKECLHELETISQSKIADIGVSCIVRTNAVKLFAENKEEFINMYQQSKEEFVQLLNKSLHAACFTCLKSYLEPYKAILERFPVNCYSEVVTDLFAAYTSLQGYYENLRYYKDAFSLANLYGLDSKIEDALNKKVWLSCGGYLVIEQTECLTTIDVNSGKMIKGTKKDASIWNLNEEAAREAAIQIRLRNLSGIIIIDFVNMENAEQEDKLLQIMKEIVKTDPICTAVIDITPLGLMEITRKKVYKSLKEQFSQ